MVVFIKISIVLLLLITSPNIILGEVMKVDYNFYNSELLVSSSVNNGDCTLTIYKLEYIDCKPVSTVVLTKQLIDYNENELIIINIPLGNFNIIITGNTTISKEIFTSLGSENITMSWCSITHNLPVWYNIYIKESDDQEYDLTKPLNVGSETTHIFDNLPPNKKYFMYITADDGNAESDPSNEFIVFTALPSNIKNLRIE